MQYQWSAVNDDELRMTGRAVRFLQGEFCPPGADPIWSPEYFRWKLGPSNPAGRGYLSLAVLDDRVVGTSAIKRTRLVIDGVQCIGGEVQDAYSASAIRRMGRFRNLSPRDPDPDSYFNKSIFGRLTSDVKERAEAAGITILFATPANDNSYPGFVNKLGFFDCSGFQVESFARPTAKLVSRKYPSLGFMSTPLRHIENIAISFQDNFYSRGICRGVTSIEGVPSVEEFSELWARLRPRRGFSLVRDASYWRHRYLEHPIAQYTFLRLLERGHLVGIIVARLFSANGGKRVVSVAEWMLEEGIPFGYALSVTVRYFKDLGVDIFNLWAERSCQKKAAGRGLFLSRGRVPIIFADTPDARLLQATPAVNHFYLGSSDNV